MSQAEISSGTATASSQGVFIKWRTRFELDNAGFNVYRVRSTQRLKLNRELIPGSTLIVGQNVPLPAGFAYSFFDPQGTADSAYLIEAVGLDGSIVNSRQAVAQWKGEMPIGPEPKYRAGLVSEGQIGIQNEYPSGSSELTIPEGQIEDQWAIAAQPGLRISVRKEGWYRVTHEQMIAVGFNPTVDIANLRLFNNARELAINTNRSRGQFVGGDYIEFYGQGLDTNVTDTNIYYLVAGTTSGKRIASAGKRTRDGVRPENSVTDLLASPLPQLESHSRQWFWWPTTAWDISEHRTKSESLRSRVSKQKASKGKTRKTRKPQRKQHYAHRVVAPAVDPQASFDFTVEKKDRLIYFVALLNGNTENFFGQVISSTPVVQTLATLNPEASATVPARLEIALQGASQVNHIITVQFNAVTLGTMSFFGLERKVQTFQIPMSQLRNGDNSIQFIPAAASGLTLVDYTRLTYAHSYRADDSSLRFTVGSTQTARVDGFATPTIRVVDYSDPLAVQLIKPLVESNDSGYTIQVTADRLPTGSTRLLYAFPEGEAEQPAGLSLNQPSSLNQGTNGADLLVISHKSFMPSLTPLANLRTSQGLIVSVVDVEDVYDEFGYGTHGPQALKEFVAFAATQWSRAPSYVILAGDASYDPRNYLGFGNRDFVPTKLVDATYNETSSDDWLTDFNNDGIADIPVGRIPAATAAQASIVVSKLVNFSPANVPQRALLVADAQRNYYFNFEQANTQVATLLPAGMTVQRVDRRLEPSDAQASINIVDRFNSGQALVNYSGHGNVNTWTDGSIFTSDLAMALNNGNKLPFVVVMDCLNGYFHEPSPGFSGLAEAFLQAPNGGAVASFASSGLTIPDGQHEMSMHLYSMLYGSQPVALGDAIKIAKTQTSDMDVRRTWIFFGDPSMKIR